MQKGSIFNLDEDIFVRGIPVKQWEVKQFEAEFGAMLFDESNMPAQKQVACANIIVELDKQLRVMQELQKDLSYLPDPKRGESVDIGDRSWLYFPVRFSDATGTIKTLRTKRFPGGVVGWFRFRRWIVA